MRRKARNRGDRASSSSHRRASVFGRPRIEQYRAHRCTKLIDVRENRNGARRVAAGPPPYTGVVVCCASRARLIAYHQLRFGCGMKRGARKRQRRAHHLRRRPLLLHSSKMAGMRQLCARALSMREKAATKLRAPAACAPITASMQPYGRPSSCPTAGAGWRAARRQKPLARRGW